jgi:hypothetical protein
LLEEFADEMISKAVRIKLDNFKNKEKKS